MSVGMGDEVPPGYDPPPMQTGLGIEGLIPAPESTTGHVIDPGGVAHPAHYNLHPSGVECIDVIKHHNLCVGTAMKYLWRQGLKDGEPSAKDLRKAIQYIEFELKRLEEEGPS